MADFVTRNRPDWDELEQLLARGRRSVGRLSPEELNRLDVLYRRVAVHLAQVRTRTRDERLAAYLNQLAAAAHTLIYLPPRQGLFKRIAVAYLLEEAAVFCCLVDAGWPVLVYPGGIKIFQEISEGHHPEVPASLRQLHLVALRLKSRGR